MLRQIEALKAELNKEMETTAELRTQLAARQQTSYLALAAAIAAAAVTAYLLIKRQSGNGGARVQFRR